ncbi:hypothetical protein [Stutzerimonas marianensis]
MKACKLTTLILITALLSSPTFAQQDTATTEQSQPPISIEQFDREMAKVQESLTNMQEQINLIRKTTDPAQRQKLLGQHDAMMRHGMQMMGEMWNGGMPGCCGSEMGGHNMEGNHMSQRQMSSYFSRMTPEQMAQHQYMMTRYMGMQQMMMDQMMQRQHHMDARRR